LVTVSRHIICAVDREIGARYQFVFKNMFEIQKYKTKECRLRRVASLTQVMT
jgi:hypothetical protein